MTQPIRFDSVKETNYGDRTFISNMTNMRIRMLTWLVDKHCGTNNYINFNIDNDRYNICKTYNCAL